MRGSLHLIGTDAGKKLKRSTCPLVSQSVGDCVCEAVEQATRRGDDGGRYQPVERPASERRNNRSHAIKMREHLIFSDDLVETDTFILQLLVAPRHRRTSESK